MLSRLGAHLPSSVHAPDAKASVVSAVGQADPQVGAGVYDSAIHEGRKGHSPVGPP